MLGRLNHVAIAVKDAEKAAKIYGAAFGAEISARIGSELFDELDAPVTRVGCPFSPIPFAPELEQALLPGTANIVHAVRELFG